MKLKNSPDMIRLRETASGCNWNKRRSFYRPPEIFDYIWSDVGAYLVDGNVKKKPSHCGPEQPRIQTGALGHSLLCLHAPHYLLRSLTRLLARSLHSLPCSWDSGWLDGYFVCVFLYSGPWCIGGNWKQHEPGLVFEKSISVGILAYFSGLCQHEYDTFRKWNLF